MSKIVTAVYDVTVGFDIEVPDDATDEDIERIANEYLDANYDEVSDAIVDNLGEWGIYYKEVFE